MGQTSTGLLTAFGSTFDKLLGRPIEADVYEDNAACITSVTKGYSTAMRYIGRTQKVQLGFLHDVCRVETGDVDPGRRESSGRVVPLADAESDDKPVTLKKVVTTEQKADIFTKELDKVKFRELSSMIGMQSKSTVKSALCALNLGRGESYGLDTVFEAVD